MWVQTFAIVLWGVLWGARLWGAMPAVGSR